MLVLDGNQKNRRDVCLAKDAGSINYSGLPGHIKTGCTASPSFKSRFCRRHSVRSSTVRNSKEEGILWHAVCNKNSSHWKDSFKV